MMFHTPERPPQLPRGVRIFGLSSGSSKRKSCSIKVKAQLEEKENKKFSLFKAVEFKSQVVAGRNFFIKVQVDDEEFVHLRVFESLPHENKPPALASYQTNKARHDELSYF
ncbi:cystatin-B [Camelus ferus]|nr:cystatin-B [Camelus ferus]